MNHEAQNSQENDLLFADIHTCLHCNVFTTEKTSLLSDRKNTA